ncbi:hypothetical protein [Vibrio neptunius]|uniref:Uncharacterized protein n=1 Tax=Vibrio neptunius TaxID=170651 RepID=A0ABS2ZX85_9VIBR|nr:hypothetical protein [Vibrio neptunius]MBN3492036.1 hypothetical protein [Vibrio neptunius]MBN3514533.1 hypothetical protein [Vibrio neptunius]MBN3549341.1 hypothetical protein [Vibrio neptunius]MBN3576866.1 hypothetical protein [Vibrio neptunius]MCH9870530.1 hypothetical protein [Vibrio neptunius]
MQKLTWVSAVIVALLIGLLIGVHYPAKYAPETKDVISSAGSIATALTLIFLVVQNVINHKKQEEQNREQREMLNLQKYENHLNLFHQRLNSISTDERYHELVSFKSKGLLYRKIFPSNNLSDVVIGLDPDKVTDRHLFTTVTSSFASITQSIESVSTMDSPTLTYFKSILNKIEFLCEDLCIVIKNNKAIGTAKGRLNPNHNVNIYEIELTMAVIQGVIIQLKEFAHINGELKKRHTNVDPDYKEFTKVLLQTLHETKYVSTGDSFYIQDIMQLSNIDFGPSDIWLDVEVTLQLLQCADINPGLISEIYLLRNQILNMLESPFHPRNEVIKLIEIAKATRDDFPQKNELARKLDLQISRLNSFCAEQARA